MTKKAAYSALTVILICVVAAFFGGYTIGRYDGHSKGYKEGLATVCSAEPVQPDKGLPPTIEADPSLNQNLYFQLGMVSFDTKGYCSVSLFSLARNKLGQHLANVGVRVPKQDCLTLPQRIGSQYRMVLTAEQPTGVGPTQSASAHP